MGLFKKSQPVDKESARLPPVEKKENTLVAIGEESEFDTIESDDVPSQIGPSIVKPEPIIDIKPISTQNKSFEEQEAELTSQLEKVRSERERILAEQEAKKQAMEQPDYDYNPQRVYLSESELLREILQKVDYLISVVHSKK